MSDVCSSELLEPRATTLEFQFAPALVEVGRQFASLIELNDRSVREANVTPSAHHRIVEVPLGCGVGIKLRHLRSPTGRPAHLAVREPSAGADRKKETGCNGHPFPTMPHRLIVVGLGLDRKSTRLNSSH